VGNSLRRGVARDYGGWWTVRGEVRRETGVVGFREAGIGASRCEGFDRLNKSELLVGSQGISWGFQSLMRRAF